MIRTGLLALAIVVVAAEPAATYAQSQNGIDRAIALFNDLEYEQAAALLEKTLARGGKLTVAEKSEGYKYLALANVVLGKYVAAKQAFRALLEINPAYRLSRTENSQALDLFEEVLNTVPAAARLDDPRSLMVSTSPVPARPGHTLTFLVSTGGTTVSRVELHYRTKSSGPYARVVSTASGVSRKGTMEVMIPGMLVKGPTLEYYVRGFDDHGKEVASQGTAQRPLIVGVSEPGAPQASKPIYRRWWFWASVGTAAAAGAALAYRQISTRNDDATVDIVIQSQ